MQLGFHTARNCPGEAKWACTAVAIESQAEVKHIVDHDRVQRVAVEEGILFPRVPLLGADRRMLTPLKLGAASQKTSLVSGKKPASDQKDLKVMSPNCGSGRG